MLITIITQRPSLLRHSYGRKSPADEFHKQNYVAAVCIVATSAFLWDTKFNILAAVLSSEMVFRLFSLHIRAITSSSTLFLKLYKII